MEKELKVYTVTELSKLLRLTPQSVRNYLRDGKIKGKKVGTKWLVSERAIKDFFDE